MQIQHPPTSPTQGKPDERRSSQGSAHGEGQAESQTHSHAESHERPATPAPSAASAVLAADSTAIAEDMARWHDNLDKDVFHSTRVIRAPGDPARATEGQVGDALRVNAAHIAVGNLAATGTQGTFTMDRQGALARVAAPAGDHTVTGTAGMLGGAAFAEVAVTSASGTKFGVGAIASPVIHGFGTSMTHTLSSSSAVGAGIFGVANVDVKAEVEALKEGKVRMNFSKFTYVGGQVTAGFTSGLFSLGARVFGARTKEVKLNTWTSMEDANAALKKQKLYQRKLQGAGLMKSVFEVPNFIDPSLRTATGPQARKFLDLEDELTIITTNTITGGVAASVGGMYLGGHASLTGEHELTIFRADTDLMRVSLAPSSKSKTKAVSIDLPFLAFAQASINKVSASRSTYDFDLTQPAAQTAYIAMVGGTPPGPILRIDLNGRMDASATFGLLGQQNLPAGVSMVSQSYVETPIQVRVQAGLSGLQLVFGSMVGSMGMAQAASRNNLVHATDSSIVERKESKNERRTESLRPGATSTTATLLQETTHAHDDATGGSQATMLAASYTLDRPTHAKRRDAISWLNQLFLNSAQVPAHRVHKSSSKYSYDITVKRPLDDEEKSLLIERDALLDGGVMRAALEAAGPSAEARKKVFARLTQQIAQRVERYGADEVGRLHKLLGDDSKLNVLVTSDAKERLKKKADLAAVQFYQPLDEASPKDAERRINRAKKLYDAVDEAKVVAIRDPVARKFSPETVQDEIKELGDIKATLLPLVSTEHLSLERKETLQSGLRSRSRDRLNEMRRASATNNFNAKVDDDDSSTGGAS